MNKRVRALMPLVVMAGLTLGCNGSRRIERLAPGGEPAVTRSAPGPAPGELTPAEDGRQIFVSNCIGCHGKNADGGTPAGRAWHVPDLRSPQVQSLSDQQLLEIIRNGRGKMPAWGGLLSQIDIAHLLAYIRTLNLPLSQRPQR